MASSSDINFDSPFVKKENCCKICGGTDGPMESIFCKADNTALLNKIYKCTRVEVTPVCGLISPICEYCHRRIDEFDENAQPRVIEFVIKTELEPEPLEYDPLNVGNMIDPMAIDAKSDSDLEEDGEYSRQFRRRRARRKVIDSPPRPSSTAARRAGRPRSQKNTRKGGELELSARSSADDAQSEQTHQSDDGLRLNGCSSREEDNLPSSELDSNPNDDDGTFPNGNESPAGKESNGDRGTSSSDEERCRKRRGRLRGRPRTSTSTKPKQASTPQQCEVCGKTVQYIREHMRLHRIDSQHPCPHCDRTFVQANNLKYHIRKHLGEKPYACQQCDKEFYCEAHLKSHMRVHGPQGLFPCALCPKSFNQECNLKKHLRVHSGEKPYVCDKCGKRFNSTSNLRNHARLHAEERPLTCDHCSKSFVDVHHLQRHVRVHTGERPYICHVCFHAFYCQNGLMEHLKTHIEKKTFKLKTKMAADRWQYSSPT
uniref:C2H2-type domain-containing protein n=1 Tax=Anopheles farauti TaxID=69004 RepID=A0A182Q7X2_9DIPT